VTAPEGGGTTCVLLAPPRNIADRMRRTFADAATNGTAYTLGPEELAWLAGRDSAAFDLETVRAELANVRESARRIAAQAGHGHTLAAHLATYARQQTPAKRRWLEAEVIPLVEDWVARVTAAAEATREVS